MEQNRSDGAGLGILAALAMLPPAFGLVTVGAAPALAHPAGACWPDIKAPRDGARTSLTPTIEADTNGDPNCRFDEVVIEITDWNAGRKVYRTKLDCCDVLSANHTEVVHKVPNGELGPGRLYMLRIEYHDKHVFEDDQGNAQVKFRTQRADRGQADRGQADRGQADRGQDNRGRADRNDNANKPSPGRPARRRFASVEPNTNRPGSDYRNFELSSADPGYCADVCDGQARCKAYTYVPPGRQGPKARCWLKDSVPGAKRARGMVSGVKRSPLPQNVNLNRPGRDYRDFDLAAAEPTRCARACAKDRRCKAYTYVPPGRQGRTARCWLKDSVPRAKSGKGMVSGTK